MNIQTTSAWMGSHKRMRQGQILKLVGDEPVANQDDLRRRLGHMGVRVTQATLSRDLRELKLVKTADGYRPLGTEESNPVRQLSRALQQFLVEIRPAQNMLVLKTPPGGAQPLAAAVDSEHWKEVAGTLAGDDTVLIITPTRSARAAIQKRMEDLLR